MGWDVEGSKSQRTSHEKWLRFIAQDPVFSREKRTSVFEREESAEPDGKTIARA